MEQQVKLLPYGVADFVTVIEQNLYYVDKTMFIPELEKQPSQLHGLRMFSSSDDRPEYPYRLRQDEETLAV